MALLVEGFGDDLISTCDTTWYDDCEADWYGHPSFDNGSCAICEAPDPGTTNWGVVIKGGDPNGVQQNIDLVGTGVHGVDARIHVRAIAGEPTILARLAFRGPAGNVLKLEEHSVQWSKGRADGSRLAGSGRCLRRV